MTKAKIKILTIVFLIFPLFVFADSQNPEVDDLLIEKLKKILSTLSENSNSRAKVILRLADLYGEKGRLKAKEESEKGCIKACTHGEKERKQALKYYQQALRHIEKDTSENSGELQQSLWLQMARLYELTDQNSKAIQFYQKAVNQKGLNYTEAQFSLAEIYFKQGTFKKALDLYESVLNKKSFKRRGFAAFRLAWCRYNTGDVPGAVSGLEKILRDPKLLTRNAEDKPGVDEAFKEEVAKDYTVFMAHGQLIGLKAIEKVFELSPGKNRIENILFLAKELERLGQIDQSEKAWEMIIAKASRPQTRTEALMELIELNFKFREKDKAKQLSILKRLLAQWSLSPKATQGQNSSVQLKNVGQKENKGPVGEFKKEIKNRLRNIVFEWNKKERKSENYSQELLSVYSAYLEIFPSDFEAFGNASQVAIGKSDYMKAYAWNQKAISLTENPDQLESLLIKRIEIAEMAKNPQWLISAQNLYLAKSFKKSKAGEIRYQMTKAQYDGKNYEPASQKFRELAKDPSVSEKLRLQSAELALDSLVLLKNDSSIELWGKEFAKIFPAQKKHFLKLVNQSILSQAAGQGDNPQKAWQTINQFKISSARDEDLKIYHKNRMILARQLEKFSELEESLSFLLKSKNLTPEDRRLALENKVWLNEIQLNFKEAYLAYKELNTGDWLQMARLADLAEEPSEEYYLNYLRKTKNKDMAFSICLRLIKKIKNLKTPYNICELYLKENKNVFANVIVDIYLKKGSRETLFNKMKAYQVEGTWAGSIVYRDLLFKKAEKPLKKLKSHRLKTHRLTASIKHRLKLISRFEKVINSAVKTKDWLIQTLLLSELKVQYLRFFEDLMALPVPSDLGDEEQESYMNLLAQQASPYKEKANEIGVKLDELWKDQNSQDQLYSSFHKSPDSLQTLLGPQIEKLRSVNHRENFKLMDIVYRKTERGLSSEASLEKARQQVRQTPMNKKAIQKLIELETLRGYQPMIIYLKSRLEKLQYGYKF